MAKPIVKIWLMSPKSPPDTIVNTSTSPSTSTSADLDPTFLALWRDIIDFCNQATQENGGGGGHFVYRSTTSPGDLVMVTGYPSRELNERTDAEYVRRGYMGRMFEWVDHGGLWMVEGVDVSELPFGLGEGEMGMEISEDRLGEGEAKVVEAKEMVGGKEGRKVWMRFWNVGKEEEGQWRDDKGEEEESGGRRRKVMLLRKLM